MKTVAEPVSIKMAQLQVRNFETKPEDEEEGVLESTND